MSDRLHIRYRDSDLHVVTESYTLAADTSDEDIEVLQGLLASVLEIHPARLAREHAVVEDDLSGGNPDLYGDFTEVLELDFLTTAATVAHVQFRGPSATLISEVGEVVESPYLDALGSWAVSHITVGGIALSEYTGGRRVSVKSPADELVAASARVDPATDPICEWYKEHGMDLVARGD